MKTTEEIERDCSRLPLELGYLKMRDHAKELELELEQSRKDRIAGAECSKRLAAKLANCSRVLNALRRLYGAADVYVACQDRATDERCGLVQPITVADGNELIAAQCEALEILQSAENEGWVYSANATE